MRGPVSEGAPQDAVFPDALSLVAIVMATRAELYDFLDRCGVRWRTVDHPPIFTVEEGRAVKASMPGGHSKNLFLKDKSGALFLVVAHCDTMIDLVAFGRLLGARGRLSFGAAELMERTLGVQPGSVTPFALMNPAARDVGVVAIDRNLLQFDAVWFHPLDNGASTAVSPSGLLAFLEAAGVKPQILELPSPNRRPLRTC